MTNASGIAIIGIAIIENMDLFVYIYFCFESKC